MSQTLSGRDLILFAESLSGLVRAGVQLPQALKQIGSEVESGALKRVLADVERDVSSGASLADAMEKRTPQFPIFFVQLVRAGVQANDLHSALIELAREYRSQGKMRDQLVAELLFPLATACVGLFVVALLVFVLIPTFFEPVYANWRVDLPILTRALFATSRHMRDPVSALLTFTGLLGFIYLLLRLWAGPGGRAWTHVLLLRMPVFRNFLRTSAVAGLCRQLSLLLSRGVPLPVAMALAEDCMWLVPLRDGLREARLRVEQGSALSDALQSTGFFPATLIMLIRGAETHGELPQTLKLVGEEQDEILAIQSKQVIFMVFICAQVVVASCVMLLLLSMFMPLFRIQNAFRRW